MITLLTTKNDAPVGQITIEVARDPHSSTFKYTASVVLGGRSHSVVSYVTDLTLGHLGGNASEQIKQQLLHLLGRQLIGA